MWWKKVGASDQIGPPVYIEFLCFSNCKYKNSEPAFSSRLTFENPAIRIIQSKDELTFISTLILPGREIQIIKTMCFFWLQLMLSIKFKTNKKVNYIGK